MNADGQALPNFLLCAPMCTQVRACCRIVRSCSLQEHPHAAQVRRSRRCVVADREHRFVASRIDRSIPRARADAQALVATLAAVIRATIKGSVAMAATQRVLGGVAPWLLGIQGHCCGASSSGCRRRPPPWAQGCRGGRSPSASSSRAPHGRTWRRLASASPCRRPSTTPCVRPLPVGRDTWMTGDLVLVATLGGIVTSRVDAVVTGRVVAAMFPAAWKRLGAVSRSALPPGPEAERQGGPQSI